MKKKISWKFKVRRSITRLFWFFFFLCRITTTTTILVSWTLISIFRLKNRLCQLSRSVINVLLCLTVTLDRVREEKRDEAKKASAWRSIGCELSFSRLSRVRGDFGCLSPSTRFMTFSPHSNELTGSGDQERDEDRFHCAKFLRASIWLTHFKITHKTRPETPTK